MAALGIDIQKGLYYCRKDEEFYKSLLLEYAKNGQEKQRDADRFYADRDYPNYKIVVHALKSTSGMIGAIGLSNLAKALEDAAEVEDDRFIRTHHEAAMAEYKRLAEGIAGAYEEPEEDEDAGRMALFSDDEVMEFAPEESGIGGEEENDNEFGRYGYDVYYRYVVDHAAVVIYVIVRISDHIPAV